MHGLLELLHIMIGDPPVHVSMEIVRVQLNRLRVIPDSPFEIIQVQLCQSPEKIRFG